MSKDSHRVIRASEVGLHGYCSHAWWLNQVEGVRPQDTRPLEAGTAVHERHGQRVLLAGALDRLSHWLLILTGLAGIGWVISWLVG